MSTKTRFEEEAKGNSEMAYWQPLGPGSFLGGRGVVVTYGEEQN